LPTIISSGRTGVASRFLQRAALALACHRHRGEHDQGHRQDHAHQTRHHVVGGQAFGVVAAVQAQFEGGSAGAQRGQRALQLVHQGQRRQRGQRCGGRAGGGGVGRIGIHRHRRPFAAQQAA
jgi:hypothetical protein